MEQRYDAMLGVIRDGISVTEVARKFRVSRQSLRAWMARYEDGGLEALADRSPPGDLTPPDDAGDRVVSGRAAPPPPELGPRATGPPTGEGGRRPGAGTLECLPRLKRHGLIEAPARRKKLSTYRRGERGRPIELWQMDVVAGVLFENSTECKIVIGIDDHSRVMVVALRTLQRNVVGFIYNPHPTLVRQ